MGSGKAADDKPVPKWKFWAKKKSTTSGEGFVAPEEWMNTDMHRGLTDADLTPRRKLAGWNELTTEKENLIIKFIGYFRGPILYSKFFRDPVFPCACCGIC